MKSSENLRFSDEFIAGVNIRIGHGKNPAKIHPYPAKIQLCLTKASLQRAQLLEPCQTSKMELFAKRVNGFQPLTIFAKSSILDI